jgi:citrate lyase subunit beta/citryl-CoA lyase
VSFGSGSSAKMIESQGLPADEVFLDLEDAVAPDAKAEARTQVAVALAEPGWSDQLRGVRVNDWTTPWTYADVIEVVSTAGASLDLVVLPKVTDVSHIHALDLLLSQLETTHGLPVGRIGIEAQIENAQGLTNVDAIAAGPRVQALVLGPADMMASLNMRTLVVGEQPEGYDVGDAYHHALMTIWSPPARRGRDRRTVLRCATSTRVPAGGRPSAALG